VRSMHPSGLRCKLFLYDAGSVFSRGYESLSKNLSPGTPYRHVRRRRAAAWTRVFPAGALAIGDLYEAVGVYGGRGGLYKYYGMGIQWPFRHLISLRLGAL
jgi:hypothetical protein